MLPSRGALRLPAVKHCYITSKDVYLYKKRLVVVQRRQILVVLDGQPELKPVLAPIARGKQQKSQKQQDWADKNEKEAHKLEREVSVVTNI